MSLACELCTTCLSRQLGAGAGNGPDRNLHSLQTMHFQVQLQASVQGGGEGGYLTRLCFNGEQGAAADQSYSG